MDSGLHFLACTPEGQLLRKLPEYASEYGPEDWVHNKYDAPFVWLKKSGQILVMIGDIERLLHNGSYVAVRRRDTYDTQTWRRISHSVLRPKTPPPNTSSGQVIYGEIPFTASRFVSSEGIPLGKWWQKFALSPFYNTYTPSWKNYYARASGDSISKGCVEVWDMRKKKKLWQVWLKNESGRAAAISSDGQMLAVGTVQGQVFFWQLRTGHLIARERSSTYLIASLAFSPNSRVLAVGCGSYQIGGGVRLLDCASHKLLAVLSAAFPENSHA